MKFRKKGNLNRNAKHTTSLPFHNTAKASNKEKKKLGSCFCEQERGLDIYMQSKIAKMCFYIF